MRRPSPPYPTFTTAILAQENRIVISRTRVEDAVFNPAVPPPIQAPGAPAAQSIPASATPSVQGILGLGAVAHAVSGCISSGCKQRLKPPKKIEPLASDIKRNEYTARVNNRRRTCRIKLKLHGGVARQSWTPIGENKFGGNNIEQDKTG
ncbi:hypothetical protein B0H17DRAFT_1176733 [Mycena rosella]|uniref:Uncharacterized protein n=1 Tax=Mycena rosella TaxID=1033263 RepID=A0AAD7DX20_MYCRO|nr:hypothetical protein B0H17DRAFT_1176733 [Mycena rosella]